MIFARRCGVKTTANTRWAFKLTFLSPYVMFFLAFHSATPSDDYVLSLGIPNDVAVIFWLVSAAAFLIAAIYSFGAFISQTGVSKMTAPLVILLTQIIWFAIPTGLMFFTDFGVLQNSATIAVLAVMHSAQYLWITTYYARREKLNEQESEKSSITGKTVWKYSSYFSILIIGGIALFLPVPWFASRVLHLDFGTSFLIITALVNIHHFILDGAIWKLRDGRIASMLLNKKSVGDTASEPRNGAWEWFFGSSISIKIAKSLVVISLLLLAGLDQAKFYYSSNTNELSSVQKGLNLNPYDASLWLKLARIHEKDGNLATARSFHLQSIRINPSYRKAHESLARLLLQSKDYKEAYAHYQEMFRHLEPDANALINYGVLAAQFDEQDEAIESWENALIKDKNQSNAHLYLAELFEQQKEFEKAIKHYERFLVLNVEQDESANSDSQPNPYMNLRVALSLGNAYQQTGKFKKAQSIFKTALELAQKMSDDEIIAEVLIYRAELERVEGKQTQALSNFQKALALNKRNPEAWLKFGMFLKELKVSPNLSLACFVKAEIQVSNKNPENITDEILKTIKSEISQLESTLSETERKIIKENIDKLLNEALKINIM